MDVSGQFHAKIALPQEKNSRYPLNKRLVGFHNQAELLDNKKTVFLLSGIN
jgi:hypothetical protein